MHPIALQEEKWWDLSCKHNRDLHRKNIKHENKISSSSCGYKETNRENAFFSLRIDSESLASTKILTSVKEIVMKNLPPPISDFKNVKDVSVWPLWSKLKNMFFLQTEEIIGISLLLPLSADILLKIFFSQWSLIVNEGLMSRGWVVRGWSDQWLMPGAWFRRMIFSLVSLSLVKGNMWSSQRCSIRIVKRFKHLFLVFSSSFL